MAQTPAIEALERLASAAPGDDAELLALCAQFIRLGDLACEADRARDELWQVSETDLLR